MKDIIETDPTVRRTTLDRNREALLKLNAWGFTGVACYSEKTAPFSLLLMFPILIYMRKKNEYVKILPDLSFKAMYPLMVENHTATFALVNALGVYDPH